MPENIFLIRHGQSTHNLAYEATGVDPLHFDAPLSGLGHRQVEGARALALSLAVDLVVTSPLTRAIETAIGLFGQSAPMVVTPLHREKLSNGCDIGRDPAALSAAFPALDFGHLPACWWYDHPERDPRGFAVEPVEALTGRVRTFRDWLLALPQRSVAIVGHGMFFKHLTGTMFENCTIMTWRPGDKGGSGELARYAP